MSDSMSDSMTTDGKGEVYYQLAPGVEVIGLEGGDLLFRSDLMVVRIEGGFAEVLLHRIIPLLDGQRPWSDLAGALADLPADVIAGHLDELVSRHLVVRRNAPAPAASGSFLAFTESIGMPANAVSSELERLQVAIFGLEGHGAHVALLLAQCGVGTIRLIDPHPCEAGDLDLLPAVGRDAIGTPRQEVIRELLAQQGRHQRVVVAGPEPLTSDSVAQLAAGCHLLVGSFDRGYVSVHHWLNRVAVEQGIPAVFSEIRGHRALVGPLVLRGRTACHMCFRMREVACAEDFQAAISYEEYLDGHKRPNLSGRAILPTLPSMVASFLATDCLRWLLGIGQPALAGRVIEMDGLALENRRHEVLRFPDCPVCHEKKRRDQPDMSGLATWSGTRGLLEEFGSSLVSPIVGIVSVLERLAKDASEPGRPYVYRGELANHRFLDKDNQGHRVFSGKGMTMEAARTSALGEAVERYGGACWDPSELVFARRDRLDGPSLDPRDLVLYAPWQYDELPYHPYDGSNQLGWLRARSLVSGTEVWVPALASFMSYAVVFDEEYLCPITSNGLAAGPTLIDAILSAALEVLERDAFMITWLARLPVERWSLKHHPDPDVEALCEAYRRRGVTFELYHLPTDHPVHVFAAMGYQSSGWGGPAVVVGLGAGFDAAPAARAAVMEVAQVRPALRRRLRTEAAQERLRQLLDDPHDVESLEEHDLLYSSPSALSALDFLRRAPVRDDPWSQSPRDGRALTDLERLCTHLEAAGDDLLYVNLTPPDLAEHGLYVVRCLLPSFQPIDFGWKERRLGGERLYTLPARLGLAPGRLGHGDLNDDPHPIA